jgi:hypothetical protein
MCDGRKQFFFEKKEPKNFYLLLPAWCDPFGPAAACNEQKSFSSFFQKGTALLLLRFLTISTIVGIR